MSFVSLVNCIFFFKQEYFKSARNAARIYTCTLKEYNNFPDKYVHSFADSTILSFGYNKMSIPHFLVWLSGLDSEDENIKTSVKCVAFTHF